MRNKKGNVIIIARKIQCNDAEITRFLKVAPSFIAKVTVDVESDDNILKIVAEFKHILSGQILLK